MHVPDGLAAFPSGVEDEAVAAAVNPLRDRHLVRVRDNLVEQSARRGQCRHIRIMVFRYYQDMRRRLGIDITEGDRAITLKHLRGRYLSCHDLAEQALWHVSIIVALRERTVPDRSLTETLHPERSLLTPPPALEPCPRIREITAIPIITEQ